LIILIILRKTYKLLRSSLCKFSPVSCHLIPLLSKCSPQHPVLEHPQSLFSPYCQRSRFTLIQNHRQHYSFVCSDFYILYSRREEKKTLD
jgi:hypothetical protein